MRPRFDFLPKVTSPWLATLFLIRGFSSNLSENPAIARFLSLTFFSRLLLVFSFVFLKLSKPLNDGFKRRHPSKHRKSARPRQETVGGFQE